MTATAPLAVRRDGDKLPVPVVETSVTVALFDRVLTETVDNQVFIVVKVV